MVTATHEREREEKKYRMLEWNCTEIGCNCVIFELNFHVFQLEAVAIFLSFFSFLLYLNLYDLVYAK